MHDYVRQLHCRHQNVEIERAARIFHVRLQVFDSVRKKEGPGRKSCAHQIKVLAFLSNLSSACLATRGRLQGQGQENFARLKNDNLEESHLDASVHSVVALLQALDLDARCVLFATGCSDN